jgi:hypothetical protein
VRGWLPLLAVGALTMLMTACTPIYTERLSTIPTEIPVPDNPGDTTPLVTWAGVQENDLLVLTWGSSSCPWEPKEIRWTSAGVYEIRLEKSGGFGLFCTADTAASVYRVPSPVPRGTPVTIDLGPGTIFEL